MSPSYPQVIHSRLWKTSISAEDLSLWTGRQISRGLESPTRQFDEVVLKIGYSVTGTLP
ncbi:hypothetical protein GCM10008938_25610 [Deinococcus roseus]|uniref:Uncharacterized protein n=1 Tax=Deinococcus roseus TaxID=392414 RepID=A0ABQ2D1V4_9DEIO|nr:hypothetical protein GCM10008938_25610 [Deinococcus roseus]